MCRAFCARAVSPVQISRSVTDTFLARTHPIHHTRPFDVRDDATGNSQTGPTGYFRVHDPCETERATSSAHSSNETRRETRVRATALRVAPASLKRVFLVTRIALVNSQAPGRWQTSVRTAQSNSPGHRRIPCHHPLRTFLALEVLHHRAPPAQHLSRPCSNAPGRRRTPCAPSALRLVRLVVFQQAADYVVLEGHHINPCGGG